MALVTITGRDENNKQIVMKVRVKTADAIDKARDAGAFIRVSQSEVFDTSAYSKVEMIAQTSAHVAKAAKTRHIWACYMEG